jgi:hypothetical protein
LQYEILIVLCGNLRMSTVALAQSRWKAEVHCS